MRAGVLAAIALAACASPAPRGPAQPPAPPLTERVPALEQLPADTLFVAATADLAATAAALGWPDVLARFGDVGPRISAELRSLFGADLLDPSALSAIGIAPQGAAGLALLPGKDLVLVVFARLEDSYRFQTFLHESAEVVGPVRTRTEGGGMVVELESIDELGMVIRGEHAMLVFADDDDELAPTLSRLVSLQPEASLARDPHFLAVQQGSDAQVGAYLALHRVADQIAASVERQRAGAEAHPSYRARLEAEVRLADQALRPIGGVAADLWLEPDGLRLEARADVAASSIWERLFRPGDEASWRAVPGTDQRLVLAWAASVAPEEALALARLVAAAGGSRADPAPALERWLGAGEGASQGISALPAAARELVDAPAELRLVIDLRRAVARQKQSAPFAAPPELGPDASPALRELVARYRSAAEARDRAEAELVRLGAEEAAETAAAVGTTAVSVRRDGQRWTLRALQVDMAEGPPGLLASFIDAQLDHLPTRRALNQARQRYWEAEDQLYQVSRDIELAQRSESPPEVVVGVDTSAGGTAGLDKDTIAGTVRRQLPRVRHCYETQLVKNPKLAGTVVVSFAIGPDGAVETASIKSSTLAHPATESCVVDVVAGLRFSRPEGGARVVVNYPFVLQAAP